MAIVDTIAWPRTLLTLSDWKDLDPDEGHHIECVEGVLVVAPKPYPLHQLAGAELVHALNRQLRQHGLAATPDTEVWFGTSPLTVRVPDVVVVRRSRLRANPSHFNSSEIMVAVEIVSTGSRRTDRVTKMSEYAEAGIGEYWILEGQPLVLNAFTLEAGSYRLAGTYSNCADLTASGAPVHLDLAALTEV